jgi:AcrR family transcriptional regulator
VAPRKYEQRLRAEAAEQTRRRILEAVYERLRAAPSEPVSLDRVARMAGVARSTVYLIYGTRAGLFDAVGADLLERGGFVGLLQATGNRDVREAMRGGIRRVVFLYASQREVLRALSSMAQLDAEAVGGAMHRLEANRAAGMSSLARRMAAQNVLRPGIGVAQAADVLWLLTSFEGFDLLYTGRSRSADDVAATLIDTAERSLCRTLFD